MKILNRKQFLAMPPGTVYQMCEPFVAGPLEIKEQTTGNDWVQQGLDGMSQIASTGSDQLLERWEEMLNHGASYPIDLDCCGRDGCYDEGQIFLVWERADVEALVARLSATLA